MSYCVQCDVQIYTASTLGVIKIYEVADKLVFLLVSPGLLPFKLWFTVFEFKQVESETCYFVKYSAFP